MGPRLDREVALKLLPAARILREGSPSSVIHEGRLLARVRHPNVVTIYGAEQIGTRVGLWMELVRGRTIDQIVREGKLFSGAEAIAIGVELCDALTAVHGAGLLHRDIKAQNAMVADDARVVLMDFGTGREVADAAASDLAGTPLYLAPEVLGGGEATVQSDIYSLGVLLYYMVSGTHPVRARDLRNLCRAHERRTRTEVRALRPDLAPVLAAIIHRATDPQPYRRYATAALLAEELKAAGSGPRSAAIGAGAHQKHWWFTSILAAACLSLVGLSCYNQRQITKQAAARHVFYAMKALDVDIANLERRIAQSGNAEANSQLQEYMRRRRGIQSVYDRYVERLNLYSTDLSQEEQLILRVTRLFGESELAAPNDYIESIKGYIRKWQSSGRFERAIRIANQMGYARPIAEEFLA